MELVKIYKADLIAVILLLVAILLKFSFTTRASGLEF